MDINLPGGERKRKYEERERDRKEGKKRETER